MGKTHTLVFDASEMLRRKGKQRRGVGSVEVETEILDRVTGEVLTKNRTLNKD